jgi:hypothetical protein
MNRIVAFYGAGTARNTLKSQVLASTTETEFVANTDAGTAIAVVQIPQQGDVVGSSSPISVNPNPAASSIRGFGPQGNQAGRPGFNSGSFDGAKPFLVRVAGVATPASNAGNTLTIKLYLGATKSGTNIATTGAVPQATSTTPVPFIVEAQLIWDSVSQLVRGQFWFDMKGTSGTQYATWAALSNAGSSITVDLLKFCASAQWGNAAGGTCNVSELSISSY